MKFFSIIGQIALVNLSNLLLAVSTDRCCEIGRRESPMYELSGHEKRSTVTIISRRRVSNLRDCEKFAITKKALAFNYRESSDYRGGDHRKDPNCQALECPVMSDFRNFINDTRFNYYSIYRSRVLKETDGLRCLPRFGIFYISEDNLNYTNAREACRKMGATLAHIASEERTEGLGKMILQISSAFVGLSNRDGERLWKNEFDEPLSCFDYRGWAKNEPANSRGCAALVSTKNPRSSSSWRVSSCTKKLPYICEIMPILRGHGRPRRN